MSLFNLDDKDMLRQIIISHYDQPNNKIEDTDTLAGYVIFHNKSASCIDDIKVYIKLENDVITDAKFSGVGCAISTASTDILCDELKNKSLSDAQILFKNYQQMIDGQPFDVELMGELVAFSTIHTQQNRIKCSLIGLEAIMQALNNK